MSPTMTVLAPTAAMPKADCDVMVPLLVMMPLSVVALRTEMPVPVGATAPVPASVTPAGLVTAPLCVPPSLKAMQPVPAVAVMGA